VDRILAIDWGTTALRAWLADGEGRVLRRGASAEGILAVGDGGFAGALGRLVGDWPKASAFAAGMIGSRQGWIEAPYASCPAGVHDLGRGLARVDAPGVGSLAIVPGVSRVDPGGVPDVMRGEESQVLGTGRDGVFVLPGTHSKWVEVADGRIVWFATFMTGEVFAVLSQHSILGRLMSGAGKDEAAFSLGVERGGESGAGLLHALFSARTLGLFGKLPEAGLRSYLSGLLIGAELSGAARLVRSRSVGVIGAPALAARYVTALRRTGWQADALGEETIVTGLLRIAEAT
jgi:2-dehydro-3-deoxygalactonokinase